jgi:DNA polymerase-3 subunit gamma/tau
LGTEPNAERRSWEHTDVRCLLAASWDYSQAAGNMAMPVIYDAVHKAGPRNLADRWYLPATQRDMDLLEKGQVPAFGIESRRQLRDFDVVGTSISYTVLLVNFCKYLSMSGVPLRWADRQARAEDYPMVMVGGLAYCAPEFMAPVVDCVWLGEAEDEPGNPGIGAVCERIAQFKSAGSWQADREGCYLALAREFNFLYFPRFTAFSYRYEDRGLPEPTKMVSRSYPLVPGVGPRFRARRVHDLNAADLMTSAPVLFSDPSMGSGDVEMARGCDNWCVFCKLGWVTKPQRQEDPERTIARAGKWRRNMGSTEISLVAPDPPAHTLKKALIAGLLENVTGRVNASSMRIDDYTADPQLSMVMQIGGTEAITFGLEGNSQLMRDLAGKGTSDEDVVRAVAQAIGAGIRKVKLYMITNWPGETERDVMRIVDLGKRLADVRDGFGPDAAGVQIIMSWTPLLIEAQTPMQWFEVTPPDYSLQPAFDALREHRIWVKIGSKANPAKLAFFQACQRASRDAGEAIVDVIEGLGVASWGGFPKDTPERLDAALIGRGFRNGLADIFGERFEHDLLGWEHIDTGVEKSLMWRVYRDMVDLLTGTSAGTYDDLCDEGYHGNEWVDRCDQRCQGNACGACDRRDLEIRRDRVTAADRDLAADPVTPLDHSTVALKLRLRVERPEAFRFVSNSSLAFIIRRAAYRACERTGFPPIAPATVRLVSGSTAYRDRSTGADYAEFGVTRRDDAGLPWFLAAFGDELAPHLEWRGEFGELPPGARLPPRPASLWELEVADPAAEVAARLRWWAEAQEVPVLVRADSFYVGATAQHGDAREHVADFWVARDGRRIVLRMVLNGRIGPYQAYAALMGRPSWIEAARYTARRVEFFSGGAGACAGCGAPVPVSLLGAPWPEGLCPRCADEAAGRVIAALPAAGVLTGHQMFSTRWGEACGQSRIQRQGAPIRPALRGAAARRRGGLGGQRVHQAGGRRDRGPGPAGWLSPCWRSPRSARSAIRRRSRSRPGTRGTTRARSAGPSSGTSWRPPARCARPGSPSPPRPSRGPCSSALTYAGGPMSDAREALATKYRPRTFGDVAGQRPVVVLLYLMAKRGTLPPAVLLSGESGSGKTTLGRIVAGAINCEAPPGPPGQWPCGSCASCTAILAGNSLDVDEVDAASNGTVEMMRELRQRAQYGPAGPGYRVFLIDEAHAMSGPGAETLLKILEEPPPRTVFILLTTQPMALPETIRGRCSPFQFRALPAGQVLERLEKVCAAEGFDAEPELLAELAEVSGGRVRDALVRLDQMAAAGITSVALWRELTGETDFAPVLLKAAADGDYPAMYAALDGALSSLGDPAHVVRELSRCLRDVLVLSCGAQVPAQGQALEARRELAARLGPARAHAALAVLWDVLARVRPDDREAGVTLAAAMIARRLCPQALDAPVPMSSPEAAPAPINELRTLLGET